MRLSERLINAIDGDGVISIENAHAIEDAVNFIRKFEEAEAEGRLVILPCKVGDTVYCLSQVFYPKGNSAYFLDAYEIENGKITMIQQKADGTWKFRVTTDFSRDVTTDALGKTVFLSREEAEAALKGRQHDV